MSDDYEYADLTFEELMIKALDSREDSAPLIEEAQRRDRSVPEGATDIEELTAVVGKSVGTEWTPVGNISLDDGTFQIACCMRRKTKTEETKASTRSMQSDEPMRPDGGSWREEDMGRIGSTGSMRPREYDENT